MATAGVRFSFCARAATAALLLAAAAAGQYPAVAPEAGDSDVRLSGAGVAGYVPGIDSAATPTSVTTADGSMLPSRSRVRAARLKSPFSAAASPPPAAAATICQ